MRILVAWELGGNYGHLSRHVSVVQKLLSKGHDILFVVKDLLIARQTLPTSAARFMQAPLPQGNQELGREIASFADILFFHGFGNAEVLESLVNSWQRIYRSYQPDIVILDHAPLALLAAGLLGILRLAIGTGFEIPPPISPYPCFRPWLNLPTEALRTAEALVLSNINRICELQKHQSYTHLADVMRSEFEVLATFPELDHYPQRECAVYAGTLPGACGDFDAKWPSRKTRNIFVYFHPGDSLPAILGTLRTLDANVVCALPGIDANLRQKYETDTLQIHDGHIRLEPLLKECDVAVTHSGHGLVSNCLLSGVPVLAIPTNMEQLLLSDCLIRLGAGLRLSKNAVQDRFASTLDRLLADASFAERAKKFSAKYENYAPINTAENIVNLIEQCGGRR